jgi:hypothetical protein|tara:strand:- start:604 stop:1071 length:468 start_codon:yes stop_codon:yes gene_type:complete
MEKRLDLKKEVYNKDQYTKTVNTSFNELGVSPLNETLTTQIGVREFFGLYNSLFYDIPALGETNSHEYMVKTSGAYINFDQDNEEIEALRAEIAQLRADLLEAQIGNITSGISIGDEDSKLQLDAIQQELKVSQGNFINTTTQVSNSNSTLVENE